MTYPPTPPTNPGYPAPQPTGGYPAGSVPSYVVAPAGPAGPSKMPASMSAAVAVLGFGAYLAGFGPLFSIKSDIGPFGGAQFTASGLTYWTVASLLAALLAAVGLLPKSKTYSPVVAVTAVLGLLLVIGQMIHRPTGFSIGWGLWLVLVLTMLQAAAATAALLYETGVLNPPAPRPNYGPYGPPQGGYYGYPGPSGAAQPSGYPPQYGGYGPGTPNQSASQAVGTYSPADSSPVTPPHGFPRYTPGTSTPSTSQPAGSWEPKSSGSSESPQESGSAPGPTPGSTPGSTQP
ncbi:MAG: DUF5336 domain-containing protein [Mycobacterium sp.]|nr:DUF5336 domain-containing protein [Mycobacterium sp.]